MITNRSTTPSLQGRGFNTASNVQERSLEAALFAQPISAQFATSSLNDCIKELPFDDAYYVREFGMDRRNYLIYQEMVAKTTHFCAAYLDAEMNGTNGYQPFFV